MTWRSLRLLARAILLVFDPLIDVRPLEPPLAPDLEARQLVLLPQITIDTGSTAVDIFASVLASVIQGDRERVLVDRTLLDTCVRFARSVRDGFDGIQLEGIAGLDAPLVVRRNDVARIELLRDETPGPKAVRVTGMLDTISATKADVVLTLTDGTAVAARLDARDNEQLKSLFGTRVVVAGLAQFRPSGKLLVIDVEYLGPARSLATWCSRACRTPRQSPFPKHRFWFAAEKVERLARHIHVTLWPKHTNGGPF